MVFFVQQWAFAPTLRTFNWTELVCTAHINSTDKAPWPIHIFGFHIIRDIAESIGKQWESDHIGTSLCSILSVILEPVYVQSFPYFLCHRSIFLRRASRGCCGRWLRRQWWSIIPSGQPWKCNLIMFDRWWFNKSGDPCASRRWDQR